MAAKYDWIKLHREFVTHKQFATTSLREFAKIKNIPYTKNFTDKTKGWIKHRKARQLHEDSKITEKLTELNVEKAVELNKRHVKIYDKVLDLIEQSIGEITEYVDMFGNPKDSGIVMQGKLKTLVQSLEIAQSGQRKALDMDKAKDNAIERRMGDVFNAMADAFRNESS